MRFEKLNKDKIRIIFSSTDLLKYNISIHSFMANPIEANNILYKLLNKAEKEIGFVTKNYNIKINIIMANDKINNRINENLKYKANDKTFIITVTRMLPLELYTTSTNNNNNNNFKNNNNVFIYYFDTFDNFCLFLSFIVHSKINLLSIAKNICLYELNNKLYLIFDKIDNNVIHFTKVFPAILEFSTQIDNANLFAFKLKEEGQLIIQNNDINSFIRTIIK